MERVCPPSIPDQSAFRFLGLQWPSHRSNSALLSELPRTKLCSGIHQLLRPGNRLYSGIHSRRRQAQQRVASVRPSGTRVLSGAIDDEWCSCPVRRFMGQYVEGPTATHRPGDKMHTACIRGLRLQWALQWGSQVSNVCRDRAALRACLRACQRAPSEATSSGIAPPCRPSPSPSIDAPGLFVGLALEELLFLWGFVRTLIIPPYPLSST